MPRAAPFRAGVVGGASEAMNCSASSRWGLVAIVCGMQNDRSSGLGSPVQHTQILYQDRAAGRGRDIRTLLPQFHKARPTPELHTGEVADLFGVGEIDDRSSSSQRRKNLRRYREHERTRYAKTNRERQAPLVTCSPRECGSELAKPRQPTRASRGRTYHPLRLVCTIRKSKKQEVILYEDIVQENQEKV